MKKSNPDEHILIPQLVSEDTELEVTLRPAGFDDYIGQEQTKANIVVAIQAAKQRKEPLDHVLIHGVSGLGKTTLAMIIAREMGAQIRATSGPAIERPGDLVSLLTNLEPGSILFIDEIHRLPRVVEEVLYSAMEDYFLDIVLGKGPAARSLRLDLPPFTLIGATTKVSALSAPLRNRFGSLYKLDFYEEADIKKIVERSARIMGLQVEDGISELIASSARRTPRVANRLLKRVRDFAEVENNGVVSRAIVKLAFDRLNIDNLGLDEVDRKILSTLITRFNGGPVGLKTLAAALAEEVDTLEDVYEPYLLRIGLLQRTAKGRTATPLAYQHLSIKSGGNPNLL